MHPGVEHAGDEVATVGGQPVGRDGQRQPHRERIVRGAVVLESGDGVGSPLPSRTVGEHVALDVEVDRVDPVPVDHGAVGGCRVGGAPAGCGELGVEGSAERHDHGPPFAVHPLHTPVEVEAGRGVVERVRASPGGGAVGRGRRDHEREYGAPGRRGEVRLGELRALVEGHVVVAGEPALIHRRSRDRQGQRRGDRGHADSDEDDSADQAGGDAEPRHASPAEPPLRAGAHAFTGSR